MDWCTSPMITVEDRGHVEVEFPFSAVTKLFRDVGNAIRIRVR
jgi:hypothetical protein